MPNQLSQRNSLLARRPHLEGLSIKGFRGINELSMSRLGRVTLVTGKNGVGKTTVLDAVRVFAARAGYGTLNDILGSRDEFISAAGDDGQQRLIPDWNSLFFGRSVGADSRIEIGPRADSQALVMHPAQISDVVVPQLPLDGGVTDFLTDNDLVGLRVDFDNSSHFVPSPRYASIRRSLLPGRIRSETEWNNLPPEILCTELGPSLVENARIARLWSDVALTEEESRAVNALKIVFGSSIERVTVISESGARLGPRTPRSRAIVKLANQEAIVPLKSLGDGAVRLFGVALALANSNGGILIVDEAENGIHHSAQVDFWRMVLQSARDNDVQVVATTHGWSCVTGFAQAMADFEDSDGVLIRIEKNNGEHRAVEYSASDLLAVAEHGIEVR